MLFLGYIVWNKFGYIPALIFTYRYIDVEGIVILIPIIIQLANTYTLTGKPTISSAGIENFNQRFFPAVYGFGESQNKNFVDYRSDEAKTANKIYPDTASKLTYIIRNPGALIKTYHYLLVRENLITGSNFIELPTNLEFKNETIKNVLIKFSKGLNRLFYYTHLIFIFIMFLLLLSKTTSRSLKSYLLILYILMLSLLLLSPLTYWQGDRLILIAEPVWLIIYSCLTSFIISNKLSLKKSFPFMELKCSSTQFCSELK